MPVLGVLAQQPSPDLDDAPGELVSPVSVPSHALSSRPETRIRRRASRQQYRRRLRDRRTWGVFLTVILALWLSGGIAGYLWPKAHGAGYVITHVVVRGILGGAIGAVLLVVVSILASVVRGRRPPP